MTTPLAGIGLRRAHRAELIEASGDAPDLLELAPDHDFADPEALAELCSRYPTALHDVGLSLGTPGALENEYGRARLARLATLSRVARPLWVSDHVAVTRSEAIDVGHLLPVWRTPASLDVLVDNVRRVQDALHLPVALENIAAPFVLPGASVAEGEFYGELCRRSGASLLLDVSNLLADAHNFGFDAAQRLNELPLAAVIEIHVAGSALHDGWRVDAHAAPVDDDSFDLLARLCGRIAPRAIVVERDAALPRAADLVREARRAVAALVTGRAAP